MTREKEINVYIYDKKEQLARHTHHDDGGSVYRERDARIDHQLDLPEPISNSGYAHGIRLRLRYGCGKSAKVGRTGTHERRSGISLERACTCTLLSQQSTCTCTPYTPTPDPPRSVTLEYSTPLKQPLRHLILKAVWTAWTVWAATREGLCRLSPRRDTRGALCAPRRRALWS